MKRVILFISFLFYCLSTAGFGLDIDFTVAVPPTQPLFVCQPAMNIDAEEYSTLIVDIASDQAQTGRLFWVTTLDPQFNESKSLWFNISKSSTPKRYVFNVASRNPNWLGFVGQVIILPQKGSKGVTITSIKAVKGNVFTTIASGWQEFWGPRGRVIEGSTVNNMRSILLFGQPYYYYLYVIIFFAALASFGYCYYLSKEITRAWQRCGQVTILTALICWGIVTASNMVNEWNWFRSDFSNYGLKTLEEKRVIAANETGPDLYYFSQFCRRELPPKAKVRFILSGPVQDYTGGRLNYFLSPINLVTLEADYLIVYNSDKPMSEVSSGNPGYRPLKQFNERGFILWKR